MNQFISARQGEFAEAIDFFKKEISSLRTGRANPAILEGVMVEAYGAKTPLAGVASVSVSDARSMLVAPWDRNVAKDVEKGIVEANLGLGVVNEGDRIRVTLPVMTEENRKELVKKLNERMEKARISIRQVREDSKNAIEEAHAKKEITEDDKFKSIRELDDHVRKLNDDLKEIRDKKEEEIMKI